MYESVYGSRRNLYSAGRYKGNIVSIREKSDRVPIYIIAFRRVSFSFRSFFLVTDTFKRSGLIELTYESLTGR